MSNLESAKYLWEEYRYRHDLIWRLLFRLTLVAVLLTITPFTINQSIRDRVGGWLTLLPILAILLAAGSGVLLEAEFKEGYSKLHVSEKKNSPRAASYASR